MRAVTVLTTALLVAALGAGCTAQDDLPSPSAAPGTGSTEPTEPTEPAQTSLEVAVYGDKSRIQTYRKIVRAYRTEEESGAAVDIELTSYPDAETAADIVSRSLALSIGPDVFLMDPVYLPQFVEDGHLQPVDVLLEDRGIQFGDAHQRVALTAFSADAGLQCMPAEASPLVVYYNKRLVPRSQLAAAGVELPRGEDGTWGWEAFAATARAVAGRDLIGPVKGVSLPADLDTLTAFVRSAGSEVVDDPLDPTSLTLASDDALQTIDAVASLARDPIVSLTTADLTTKPPVDWFIDGDLGMFIGTRDDLPRLRATEGLRFDVFPLPSFGRSRSISQMNGYCIAAGTEQVDAAADFVAFAVGNTGSEIAAASEEIVPSNLDVAHSEAFTEPGKQPRHPEEYLAGVRRSDPLPFSTAWLDVGAEADKVLQQLYTRLDIDLEATLEDRMTRLDARSEQLFAASEGRAPE